MVTPGLIIAAPQSGSGKTTLATGLMAALAATQEVAPFKVGPDYIDPSYHALATGRAGRNLDAVLCPSELIGLLYAHGTAGADIAIIEGVMGLFDGQISADPSQETTLIARGSTAHIAQLLQLPVVLVVDARRQSTSVGALVRGFATAEPDVRIAGVILNQVASPRHEACLRNAVEQQGVPVLGAVPKNLDLHVPSRHLGLITAGEHGAAARAAVAQMQQVVSQYVDLAAVQRLARPASVTATAAALYQILPARQQEFSGTKIILAAGPAFSFTYAELTDFLTFLGVQIISWDPLVADLPAGDGLIIPGGFPEEHLAALAKRTSLRQQLQAFSGPIWAECAGLLLLCDTLDGQKMGGLIPAQARMTGKVKLGYRGAVAIAENPVFAVGTRLQAHEFHHTELAEVQAAAMPAAFALREQGQQVGFATKQLLASYLHVHPAGVPAAIVRFVATASGRI